MVTNIDKGNSSSFSSQGLFDIILEWNDWDNNKNEHIMEEVDLCVFYLTKNNRSGGVFTRDYRKGYEGDLENFPYI